MADDDTVNFEDVFERLAGGRYQQMLISGAGEVNLKIQQLLMGKLHTIQGEKQQQGGVAAARRRVSDAEKTTCKREN